MKLPVQSVEAKGCAGRFALMYARLFCRVFELMPDLDSKL
jgi:hypothetical protein